MMRMDNSWKLYQEPLSTQKKMQIYMIQDQFHKTIIYKETINLIQKRNPSTESKENGRLIKPI